MDIRDRSKGNKRCVKPLGPDISGDIPFKCGQGKREQGQLGLQGEADQRPTYPRKSFYARPVLVPSVSLIGILNLAACQRPGKPCATSDWRPGWPDPTPLAPKYCTPSLLVKSSRALFDASTKCPLESSAQGSSAPLPQASFACEIPSTPEGSIV